jgi:Beta xylosidase C-terminal Concanavalin A-like domain
MRRNRTECLRVIASWLVIMLAVHSAYASTPVPASPGAPLASSFPGPFWDVVAPQGGTALVSNAHLFIDVPGGSNHDALLPSNQAVRVVQPIGNENFDVAIKIDSPAVATNADTSQGLMLLADERDFITFAVVTDGTHISLNAHTVTNGTATTVFDDSDFTEYQNPVYLRISRAGITYTAFYSIDGVIWKQVPSFTYTAVPTWVGPFAGNYNPTPAKALPVVMSVNWFNVEE